MKKLSRKPRPNTIPGYRVAVCRINTVTDKSPPSTYAHETGMKHKVRICPNHTHNLSLSSTESIHMQILHKKNFCAEYF